MELSLVCEQKEKKVKERPVPHQSSSNVCLQSLLTSSPPWVSQHDLTKHQGLLHFLFKK